jgi:hypothetical protein
MTNQALTDDAPVNDEKLYRYDVDPDAQGHHLTYISNDGVRGVIGASDDGDYVYFLGNRIDLWHNGTLRTIGPKPIASNSFSTMLTDGPKYGITLRQAGVTPDGRHLVFDTDRPVGDYNQGTCASGFACREVYVYSAATDQISCASCHSDGAPSVGGVAGLDETATVGEAEHGGARGTSHVARVVSADGHYVFFNSIEALVSRDTDGAWDAYQYDTETNEVSLLSSGTNRFGSYFLETDSGGDNAFIVSRQSLTGSDTDAAYDLYDVRDGGGFPEPAPKPAICEGETCQGPQTGSPHATPVGSGNVFEGNTKPVPRPCPKGKHRIKVHGKPRCVHGKVHTKGGTRPHRRAGLGVGGHK